MSDKNKNETWICPLGYFTLPYGTSCKDIINCGDVFNANAHHYVNLETREHLNKSSNARGTGISEIANAENS